MYVVITYDVSTIDRIGKKRLRRVAKICEDFGQRVQNSVFECLIDPVQLSDLRFRIEKEIDKDRDSLRYYFLGANWQRRVEHVGAKKTYNPEGVIML